MSISADLRLEPEWLPVDGVTSPELAATWCRLSITVGADVVSRVEDLAAHSTRTGIYCSAYPLAEWIATHWWALRSHVRAASALEKRPGTFETGPSTNGSVLRAHDFRSAGDGFYWPALYVVPEGERTLVVWEPDRRPRDGALRFVSSGRAWSDPSQIQSALSGFVDSVLERLRDFRVTGTLLEQEWSAVVAADADEAAFCDTAAALGLDPYDISSGAANAIEKLDSALGPELVAEFAAAADPKRISEDLSWVQHGMRRVSHKAGRSPQALGRLLDLRLPQTDDGPPWELGWAQARTVRRTMGLTATDAVDLSSWITHKNLTSVDLAFQALGSGVSGKIELVLGTTPGAAGRRFLDGRALWRTLHVRDRPYLLTTAATYEQRVERAFAAELLAPAAGVEKLVESRGGIVPLTEVERAARRFKASPVVVVHQLENQLGLVVAG